MYLFSIFLLLFPIILFFPPLFLTDFPGLLSVQHVILQYVFSPFFILFVRKFLQKIYFPVLIIFNFLFHLSTLILELFIVGLSHYFSPAVKETMIDLLTFQDLL